MKKRITFVNLVEKYSENAINEDLPDYVKNSLIIRRFKKQGTMQSNKKVVSSKKEKGMQLQAKRKNPLSMDNVLQMGEEATKNYKPYNPVTIEEQEKRDHIDQLLTLKWWQQNTVTKGTYTQGCGKFEILETVQRVLPFCDMTIAKKANKTEYMSIISNHLKLIKRIAYNKGSIQELEHDIEMVKISRNTIEGKSSWEILELFVSEGQVQLSPAVNRKVQMKKSIEAVLDKDSMIVPSRKVYLPPNKKR